MIKLNNKNITYVALADSSNSLKAPKEIWYADSSKSVKLVYRRKDALIEGEDYEKYHWLVGDADAYINTLNNYHPYEDSVRMIFRDNLYPNRATKYNKYNVEEQIWGTDKGKILAKSYLSGTVNITIGNPILDMDASESIVNWSDYTVSGTINDSEQHSIYISSVNNNNKYSFIHNGSEKSNLSTRYTLPEIIQGNVYVFNKGVTNGYFNGSFFNFIHYRNNVEITHLIPCKLLKPVPKWLDANGIRRQVGECGMIDLISGKFYGNVNSVGTFTVENYYERKEWLQGDGSAYIDTLVALKDVTAYKIKAQKDEYYMKSLFGANDSESDRLNVLIYSTADGVWRVSFGNTDKNLVPFSSDAIEIEWDGSNVYVNGENKTSISYSTASTTTCTLFFCKGVPDYRIFNGKIASLTIPSKINLVPCTLTMDLPASMDANNIARTKGTSGMWDLVSDRFYGNVANSGTFKAVNLAEGVDYEVHDWLQGRNGAYIDTLHKIKAFDDKFEVHYHYDGNIKNPDNGVQDVFGYASENNNAWIRHYITSSNYAASNYFKQAGDWYHSGIITNDATIELWADASSFYYKVNDNNFTFSTNGLEAGEYPNCYVFACNGLKQTYSNRYFHGDIAYFKITDSTSNIKMNLIPVKLLRSIPSKYDANGIARQAGECGMYNTVNDLFYGNVASSGTFSVEDDE